MAATDAQAYKETKARGGEVFDCAKTCVEVFGWGQRRRRGKEQSADAPRLHVPGFSEAVAGCMSFAVSRRWRWWRYRAAVDRKQHRGRVASKAEESCFRGSGVWGCSGCDRTRWGRGGAGCSLVPAAARRVALDTRASGNTRTHRHWCTGCGFGLHHRWAEIARGAEQPQNAAFLQVCSPRAVAQPAFSTCRNATAYQEPTAVATCLAFLRTSAVDTHLCDAPHPPA